MYRNPGYSAVGGCAGPSYPVPQGSGGNLNTVISYDIRQWFTDVDRDRSGKINADDLSTALVRAHRKLFSDNTCSVMIGMFDKDKRGTIDINEFQQLYTYVGQWLSVFRTYDSDQSGHIEEPGLAQALKQMGFRFSPEFIKLCIAKSDPQNHQKISLDQFIVVCVQTQRFTEAFRLRDMEMKEIVTIGFEDFLGVALECSV